MPGDEQSPLLPREDEIDPVPESAPLLSGHPEQPDEEDEEDEPHAQPQPKRKSWFPWPRKSRSSAGRKESRSQWRWASIIAMVILAVSVVLLMILGFVVPPAVKAYAEGATIIEPTGLSIESLTPEGVRARIQGNVRLDGMRVQDHNARRIGVFVGGIMRKLETKETNIHVYLPDFDNALLGSAVIPPLTASIVEGQNNALDFVADLQAGDADRIRMIANEWLEGRLDQLKVTGKTVLHLKSGIFPLGSHDVVESMVFEAQEIPSVPDYKIERLTFHDIPGGDSDRKAVGADVSLTVHNDYPVAFDVPPLAFEVLVSNCELTEPHIMVAEATTSIIHIGRDADVTANASGVMRDIPDSLTRVCPKSELSPLDYFMQNYLHGEESKIFIRGKKTEDADTPEWIGDILESITVPFEFPGSSFGNLIKNFSLSDVDFQLPSPFADPSDPDSQPKVSGSIEVLAALPPEFDIALGVDSIRADADLLYKKEKLGELNLPQWHKANSTRLVGVGGQQDLLNITSTVVDVPLNITNGTIFATVMQKMLFGDGDVILDVQSTVDVKVSTVLGNLVVKNVPAEGRVPVNALPGDLFGAVQPQVSDLRVLNTSGTGMQMQGSVNLTNPTPYTASIPYLSVFIFSEGHQLGEAITRSLDLHEGNNTGITVDALWDPLFFGGETSQEAGRRFLSDYLSGKNTSLTLKPHAGSIPAVPSIGEALSHLNVTVPAPRFKLPGDDKDGGSESEEQHFIREATFHVFSSTASFVLASPLRHNIIHIEAIDAVAFYNHTEPIGRINDDEPFDAPPGLSETPKLPVQWSLDSVGYDKLKEALGGHMKLDAVANVTVRIGNWIDEFRYEGKGIGAKVRL